MNGVRLEDLPPEARARVQAALDLPAKRKRTTQRHVGVREARPVWRCHDCHEEFTVWAKAMRHQEASGHRRLDIPIGHDT